MKMHIEVILRIKRKGKRNFSHSILALAGSGRGGLPTAADSTGARGQHLIAMAVRMRWNGQGFGDLLIKSGVGVRVTWVIGLPKEMELGFAAGSGSGAQELCHRVPMEAEPSDRTEDLGTGHQAESGNICCL